MSTVKQYIAPQGTERSRVDWRIPTKLKAKLHDMAQLEGMSDTALAIELLTSGLDRMMNRKVS